jgi:Family of unknown function (DUF5754)
MKDVIVVRRDRSPHKWRAEFPDGRTVHFGRVGYSDYTIHKDHMRMLRYLTRHAKRESWGPSGKYTAGFWSRWLLWSKPSLRSAAKETEKALGRKFRIKLSM